MVFKCFDNSYRVPTQLLGEDEWLGIYELWSYGAIIGAARVGEVVSNAMGPTDML